MTTDRSAVSSHQDQQQPTGPYSTAALRYHATGWAPLPLPPRAKGPVPTGWTGRDGAWPSGADVWAWTEDHPNGNLALRLPPDVIGIDVDAYDPKPGGMVLTTLEEQLGELPPTWRSTSRDDGASGIRLYRIPTGKRWPGILGPGIEVIRHAHRYTVAWPSVHPDTGGTYRWITPDGATALDAIPTPNDLPDLPTTWIGHFTKGDESEQARAGLDTTTSSTWLQTRGQGVPCNRTSDALTRAMSDLTTGASRHDAALAATNRLIWLAGEGHPGVTVALQQLAAAFLTATTGDRQQGEAEHEWDRMVLGAVDLAAAAHPQPSIDPCTDPFAGLIPKERPCTTNSPTTQTAASSASPTPSNSSSPSLATPHPDPTPTALSTVSDSAHPTTSSTLDAPATDLEPDEDDRTSWWPRALATALGNTDPEPPPTHLTRTDGHSAFYTGRVNGIIGPSESGKTWVALHAAHQSIEAGQNVTYIDFEDSERGIVGRLLALGADPDLLQTHLAYIGPDEPFHPLLPTGIDLHEHLEQHAPTLVILDGVNAAMTLQGWDLNSNKDATAFAQQILKPLATEHTAVVYIDHTPKDTENASKGGIGAQAKRAMTSGCTIRVDAVKPFGKGQNGKLRIHVDKDRQGDVRGVSAPGKNSHWFGDFTLTHNNVPGPESIVTAALTAPEGFDPDQPQATPPAFRPTGLMAKISTYLEHHPGAGVREIRDAGLGRKEYVGKALDVLVTEGWVRIEKGPRSKSEHHLDTPFDELLTPPNDCAPDRAPTVLPEHAQTTVPPCSQVPDVVRPERGTVETREDTTNPDRAPGAPTPRTSERVIAGQRVTVNLDTGEVVRP